MFKKYFDRFLPLMAPEGASAGETNPESAELEEEEGAEDPEITEQDDEDEDPEEEEPEEDERDYERDAAFAQMRREKEEAEQRAAEAMSWFERDIKGSINPYTEEPIETIEDYNEYVEQYQQDQLEQAGLPADLIEKAIANHPLIRQAEERAEREEQLRKESMFNTELDNIRRLNPEIKSLKDLKNIEDYDVFEGLVKSGMHIDAAYKRLMSLKQPKGEKKDTTGHMKTVDGVSGNDINIPAETLKYYKALMPHATMKEIRAHYAKSKRGE